MNQGSVLAWTGGLKRAGGVCGEMRCACAFECVLYGFEGGRWLMGYYLMLRELAIKDGMYVFLGWSMEGVALIMLKGRELT